jgi:choline dehydrogenase-like flavoprotein
MSQESDHSVPVSSQDDLLEKARNSADSPFDYIIVGSGAGGGPLAARLALAGRRVLLLEAGQDPAKAVSREYPDAKQGEIHDVPGYHGASTEDKEMSWQFSVRHYGDDAAQRTDHKYDAGRDPASSAHDPHLPGSPRPGGAKGGIFYPRSSGLGGCTGHHAMIIAAPNDRDWEHIAEVTGDDSWRAVNMRSYFMKLERCLYLSTYYKFIGSLLGFLFDLWRRVVRFFNPRAVLDNGGHGDEGWQPTSFIPPLLIEAIAKKDHAFLKLLKNAVFSVVFADRPLLGRIKHALLNFRLLRQFDPNDLNTRLGGDKGVFLIPTGVGGPEYADENDKPTTGRRTGLREHLLRTAKKFPDRLVIKKGFHVVRVEFKQDGNGGAPRAVGVTGFEGDRLYDASPLRPAERPENLPEVSFYARGEVILCGGAFNTPQLLMLSGIGDREQLQRHGINCRVHLPGVGRNLQDRYEVCVISELNGKLSTLETASFTPGDQKDTARAEWLKDGTGLYGTNGGTVALVFRSTLADGPEADIFAFGAPAAFRGYYWNWSKQLLSARKDAGPSNTGLWSWVILKAYTRNNGGTVTLNSASPFDTPSICFRSFEENPNDQELGWAKDLSALEEAVEMVRKVNGCNPTQFRNEVQPGIETRPNGSRELQDWIKSEAWGHHACGTCRMGSDPWRENTDQLADTDAVLDSRFQVHGVKGLRIVDASIFPKIPGYFILTPIFMASEKAADVLLSGPLEEIYPEEIARAEQTAVIARREKARFQLPGFAPQPEEPLTVGLALSGGGVRCATFALGVLQCLAGKNRLRGIDYLSSVSGGGFTGSFLGRLFTRREVTESKDPCGRVQDILCNPRSTCVAWLRTQANYIFATESDTRGNAGIVWRNLFSVHLVIGALFFAFFGLLAGLSHTSGTESRLLGQAGGMEFCGLILTAWWWLPLAVLALGLLPGSLGYWLAPKTASTRVHPPFVLVAWLILLIACGFALAIPATRLAGLAGLVVLLISWFWQEAARWGLPAGTGAVRAGLIVRNRLSRSLGEVLMLLVLSIGLAVLDTLAHTAAVSSLATTLAAVAALLAPVMPWVQSVMDKIFKSGKLEENKSIIPVMVTVLLALFLLLVLDMLAHQIFHAGSQGGWTATVVALLFSLTLGRAFDFLNFSSLHSAYAARLTRTYLGATNPSRIYNPAVSENSADVQQAHPGDDIPLDRYHPEAQGGPLHLINVCVNETVDAASDLDVPDRKGLPMCVGPHAVSVGRRFHAVWDQPTTPPRWQRTWKWIDGQENSRETPTSGLRALVRLPGTFHVLSSRETKVPTVEKLTLGGWTAVSGAAFATGAGRTTSLLRSFAMGFSNLRLGYWWDSGVLAHERPGRYPQNFWRRLKGFPDWLFRMQGMLLSEWRGRFHGPNRWFWNLSDGGHFDDSGLYELIRRRVGLMIAIDGSGDPGYRWESMAVLGRTVRQDFGATIEWLDPAEVQKPGVVPQGVLEWINAGGIGRLEDIGRHGKYHAALAKVTYLNGKAGWLALLKTSLTNDEPRDIIQYAAINSAFPQDPVSDQVFDDAQWESYRMLGQHVAESVIN